MGPAKGAANIQIGIRWSGVEVSSDGARGRVKNIEFVKYSASSITDQNNSTVITANNTIQGSIPDDLNFNGKGLKVLRNLGDGMWVDLSYTDFARSEGYITTSGINAAGTNLTVEFSIGMPRRQVGLPSAPTGLTASLSGTSATLAWSNTSPSDPAKPYGGTSVRRRLTGPATAVDLVTGLGRWEVVANPGVVTSYVNAGLPVNSRVEYQVAGRNASGTGTWSAVSSSLYTALAVPTGVSAAKNAAGGIVITATNQALWATHLRYQDSQDGVSWADVGSPVATSGIGVKTYTQASPDQDITHRYRVRAERGGLVSGWSPTSNIVALRQKPNVPTILGPTAAQDPAEDVTLSWRHNPLDTTPQTQREVRFALSTDGGATWPGWTSFGQETTSSQARTVPAGTFGVGVLRFQVRTRGAHPDWSDWSANGQVTLTSRPVAGIVFPVGTVVTSTISPDVSFYDPEGLAQSGSRMVVTVPGDSQPLETVQASGSADLPPFQMRFLDGLSYQFAATVTNAAGLTSAPVVATIPISYLPPGIPSAVTEWDRDRGALAVTISNPTGSGGGSGAPYDSTPIILGPQTAVDPAGDVELRWQHRDGTTQTAYTIEHQESRNGGRSYGTVAQIIGSGGGQARVVAGGTDFQTSALVRPERGQPEAHTGKPFVHFEQLYHSSDATLQDTLNRVTSESVLSFPEGEFILNGFDARTKAGIDTGAGVNLEKNLIFGLYGMGKPDHNGNSGTIFIQPAGQSTKGGLSAWTPTQAQGGTTQVRMMRLADHTGKVVLRNFGVQGTPQARVGGVGVHNFEGIYLYNIGGDVLIEDVFVGGWCGDNGAPPGETSGLAVSMNSAAKLIIRRVSTDGRYPGGQIAGTVGIHVMKALNPEVHDSDMRYNRISANGVSYHTIGATWTNCILGYGNSTGWPTNAECNDLLTYEDCVFGPTTTKLLHATFSNTTHSQTLGGTTYPLSNGRLTVDGGSWGPSGIGDAGSKFAVQSWESGIDGSNTDTQVRAPRVLTGAGVFDPYRWVHGTHQNIDTDPGW